MIASSRGVLGIRRVRSAQLVHVEMFAGLRVGGVNREMGDAGDWWPNGCRSLTFPEGERERQPRNNRSHPRSFAAIVSATIEGYSIGD